MAPTTILTSTALPSTPSAASTTKIPNVASSTVKPTQLTSPASTAPQGTDPSSSSTASTCSSPSIPVDAKVSTHGNPVVKGNPSQSGSFIYVLASYPLPEGYVCSFSAYMAVKNVSAHFQIWKNTGNNQLTTSRMLIQDLEFTAPSVGEHEISVTDWNNPIKLKGGEYIGIMMPNTGSVGFSPDTNARTFYTELSGQLPTTGQTISIEKSIATYRFSVSIVIANYPQKCSSYVPPCAATTIGPKRCGTVDSIFLESTPTGANVTSYGADIVEGIGATDGYIFTILYTINLSKGWLCNFKIWISKPGAVSLQIWRAPPNQDSENLPWLLVGNIDFTAKSAGPYTVDVDWNNNPIEIADGDKIGFYNKDGITSIAWQPDASGQYSTYTRQQTNKPSRFPQVGEIYTISTSALIYKYMIKAEVASHPTVCSNFVVPTAPVCTTTPGPTQPPTTQPPTTPVRTSPAITSTITPAVVSSPASSTTQPPRVTRPIVPGFCPVSTDPIPSNGKVQTFGNPVVQSGDTVTAGYFSMVIISESLPAGYVCRMNVYSKTNYAAKAQIYRPTKTQYSYKLIADVPFQFETPGEHTIKMDWSNPIKLEGGEHLGGSSLGNGSYAIRIEPQTTVFRQFDKAEDMAKLNEIVSISTSALTYKLSLSVDIAPHPELCKCLSM
ncbi:uncharacterized protein LOC141906211 [Tubulanus polymorphus]|uniref:uncharacterized protein LOC141906211 n=1 Tax=Tubulanus polymorphus TaxID=672921 RepID=UPI003DA68FC6